MPRRSASWCSSAPDAMTQSEPPGPVRPSASAPASPPPPPRHLRGHRSRPHPPRRRRAGVGPTGRSHAGPTRFSPWLDILSFGRGGLGLVILAIALGQPRLLVIAIVYSVVASTLVWFRRTWSFDGSTITLDDGVISRTYRRVPVTRVQQVEVNEPLLHRMTGLPWCGSRPRAPRVRPRCCSTPASDEAVSLQQAGAWSQGEALGGPGDRAHRTDRLSDRAGGEHSRCWLRSTSTRGRDPPVVDCDGS
jgi:hypothetical protein